MRRRRSAVAESDNKRCAIYTRKSTSAGLEQEFNTLHAQREACQQYIASQAHQGWKLISTRYDDGGFTGANLERPAFARLMDDIDAGQVDLVVVYKVDRLSRSLLDFARVMDRFQQAGVSFVSITQNFSTADAMGRLTLNMLMSFAEFEREMSAERTRDKIAAARRKGKWTGGLVPVGYDVVDKKLVVNNLEAVVVDALFTLYEQHQSALTVARLLNRAGYRTKPRRAGGELQGGRAWTKHAVLRVLRNPMYAGLMLSGEEHHEGEHEAIIARERYERIRALLDTRGGERGRPGRNPAYILRGLLRCKYCGGALTPASSRKNGRKYRYYRCVTRDRKGSKACVTQPLPADELETFVVAQIRQATADGELAGEVSRQFKMRVRAQRRALKTECRELPALIASLSAEVTELVERLSKSTGTASRRLEERVEEVSADLERHKARLQDVERALVLLSHSENEAEWIVHTLGNFDAVWDHMSLENRGRLVRAVLERVEIDEPNGRITAVLADLEPGRGASVPCSDGNTWAH